MNPKAIRHTIADSDAQLLGARFDNPLTGKADAVGEAAPVGLIGQPEIHPLLLRTQDLPGAAALSTAIQDVVLDSATHRMLRFQSIPGFLSGIFAAFSICHDQALGRSIMRSWRRWRPWPLFSSRWR